MTASAIEAARQFADGLPSIADEQTLFCRESPRYEWRRHDAWSQSVEGSDRMNVTAEKGEVALSFLSQTSCTTHRVPPAIARAIAAELIAAADAAEKP